MSRKTLRSTVRAVCKRVVDEAYWRLEDPQLLAVAKRAQRENLSPWLFRELSRSWLKERHIRTIIDAGANIGRWSRTAARVFTDADIFAFEPIDEAYRTLELQQRDIKTLRTFHCALGDTAMVAPFNRHQFQPSSSLLSSTPELTRHFDFTAKQTRTEVRVQRLDDLLAPWDLKENILVKMDVQGYELHVIRGAMQTLAKTNVAVIEVSFRRFYEGEPLFDGVYEAMKSLGFVLHGTIGSLNSPVDGLPLQADCLFLRT